MIINKIVQPSSDYHVVKRIYLKVLLNILEIIGFHFFGNAQIRFYKDNAIKSLKFYNTRKRGRK